MSIRVIALKTQLIVNGKTIPFVRVSEAPKLDREGRLRLLKDRGIHVGSLVVSGNGKPPKNTPGMRQFRVCEVTPEGMLILEDCPAQAHPWKFWATK